jgi:hypothetical protein
MKFFSLGRSSESGQAISYPRTKYFHTLVKVRKQVWGCKGNLPNDETQLKFNIVVNIQMYVHMYIGITHMYASIEAMMENGVNSRASLLCRGRIYPLLKGCSGCWGANPGFIDFFYFLVPSLHRWAICTGQRSSPVWLIHPWGSKLAPKGELKTDPRLLLASFWILLFSNYLCIYHPTYVCIVAEFGLTGQRYNYGKSTM